VNADRYERLVAIVSNESIPVADWAEAIDEALGSDGPTVMQHVGLLRACLASPASVVRDLGVHSFGGHGSPRITSILRELLDDPSPIVQEAALSQPAHRQDPRAYDVCASWLSHGSIRRPGLLRIQDRVQVLLHVGGAEHRDLQMQVAHLGWPRDRGMSNRP
jgi:hypothetical protein